MFVQLHRPQLQTVYSEQLTFTHPVSDRLLIEGSTWLVT